MIIVSGCPRSGTSLMMKIFETSLGRERILGTDFRDRVFSKVEGETDQHFKIRSYLVSRKELEVKNRGDGKDKAKEMNPDGFWECGYTVKGIQFNLMEASYQRKLLAETEKNMSICKIVSQGLFYTDPRFVTKMVFMLRNPRSVAKSQERLDRKNFVVPIDQPDIKIHSPEMFINVSRIAVRWFDSFPEVKVCKVLYDDLIMNTVETIKRISEFIGEDLTPSIGVVKPELFRSLPEDVASDLWTDSEIVYDKMVSGDYSGVLKYLDDPKLEINQRIIKHPCFRRNVLVNGLECRRCNSNKIVMRNFRGIAQAKGIQWKYEPCMYECGFNPFKDPIGIEESISNNSWSEAE